MNKRISGFSLRLVVLVALAAASLLAACKKNYVKVDDKLIRQYLDDQKITNGQRQESGLYYVPLTTDATQPMPRTGQTVSVLYTGRLLDGTVFDATSRRNNAPFNFVLGRGQVIEGWDEGIALMHKGDKALLLIPSAMGYGSAGSPPTIPANAVLQFEVELVGIK
ncbi:FKBP-type peptidyl-prolyl cis-trans isomerase [Hymenobacter algoricola]|uniref:Peptidyl-prolyl cis-trans isomerase n=1 Tax=Hymenobacter algoricola TaxID=486267 RepID=A0ABP7N1B8_9BACT